MADSTVKDSALITRMAIANGLHNRHVIGLLKTISDAAAEWLAEDETIIIRGFGSFTKNVAICDGSKVIGGKTRRVSIRYRPSGHLIIREGDGQ